ncbi:RagB/SusD family nutrient uptake outer membrane protein [Prevotella sp.]|uniref:RagB/SusD family nutrient uptake outer membrane protein n=1 Tax=Prevotella sp. TaxID=59823 RepID=UPI003DA646EC
MKIYINKFFFAGLIAVASLSSCSSDYLNTNPTESVSYSDVISSTDNMKKALNGISKAMTTQQYAYSQGFAGENAIIRLYEDLPSQDYNYNIYASGWAPIHNQTYHLRTNSIYDSYAWYYYYQIIGSANVIINNVDAAAGSDADKAYVKASALTFRAYAFQKLVNYYCYRWQDSNNGATQGLVLRLDESTGDLAYSTLAETYKQIYTDCTNAINLFEKSGEDRPSGKVWLPNVNVAHAVYARAALTKQDYSTALDQAKLARNGYDLMDNASYTGGFCKPTSEWIMGSYGASDQQNWYWSFGTQMACNGYSANNTNTGAGTIGHELIERIPDNDTRKQLFITEDKFSKINIKSATDVHQNFGILGLGNDAVLAQADSICKAHTPSGMAAAYQSGYIYLDGQLKFWVDDQPGVGYIPFIRSSEMLLIEAEADYFLNKPTDAQNALIELNVTSKRNPDYTCTKTGDELFAEIRDYRNLELWGEGFEWSDFKRWNLPIVRHSFAQGGNAHVSVAITINPSDGNKWTWEVPLNETEYNAALKAADASGNTPK